MKKLALLLLTVGAVLAAALIPPGAPVSAAGSATTAVRANVSAVRQSTWQTNATVHAVTVSGGAAFAGGKFTQVRPPGRPAGSGDVPRKYLAAFFQSSGNVTSWAPVLNGAVYSVAVSPDGKRLIVGGDFTRVNGQVRNRIAAFDLPSGALVADWNPSVSYRVKALAVYGQTVYLGGSFGLVDGQTRNRLAAVSLGTGALLPNWKPSANGDVYAIDTADNGSRVFAGGPFTQINGASHNTLVSLHPTTGAPQTFAAASAIPRPTDRCTTRVKDIDTAGNTVYVANGGDGVGCYDGTLAANISTGQLLWKNNCLGATEAIKAIGSLLYKGSHAHNCSADGGFPEGTGTHYLLAQSTSTGKLGPWFPNTNAGGTTKVGPLAMAGDSSSLWVGGDFTVVNGATAWGITRFTTALPGARPPVPAAAKVSSTVAGKVNLSFQTVADTDNIALTYRVYRFYRSTSTLVGTWNINSYFWSKPTLQGVDTVPSGRIVSYRVQVLDGENVVSSATSAAVVVR